MEHFNGPVNILCVDDEKNVLRALERVFLDDDYEITTTSSGVNGLQLLEASRPFQVVISDYRMPNMNGVEFLKEVYLRWPETIRIVLSGYADAGAIVDAINEGHIYKFIPKPWNDDELRVTIQNCIELYFLQKKNKELFAELEAANRKLEEKVQQRTEQLEIRNRALEFSQNLLGKLPVGVIGIDENGMVVFSNSCAIQILKPLCKELLGSDITMCGIETLPKIIELIPEEGILTKEIEICNKRYRILGRRIVFFNSSSIALVFSEE